MNKVQLRSQLLQRLNALSFHDLIQKSQNFRDIFAKKLVEPYRHTIGDHYAISFCPFSTEPQVNLEVFDLNIGYVRINSWEQGIMDAAAARRDVPGQWTDFSPQAGVQIYQPSDSQPSLPPEHIAVILVPGLGFDRQGRRIGRGKGFYDRYLKTIPHALRVGVVFHEQMVLSIDEDAWDERVDVILTDQEWIETERFGVWKKHGTINKR